MHNDRIAGALAVWLRRGMFVIALALAACGGSGSSNSSNNSSTTGGGSGTTPPPTSTPSAASNTVPVTVAQGVEGVTNIPTVSVTVCAPGTSNCQTIDNVQVDTGSYGLRVLASALPSSVASALPVSSAANGGTLAECAGFADGYMWGTVRTADVKIGGETASAIPIQVVGDLAASTVPQPCQNLGSPEDTQTDVAANGILGIGVAPTDCGAQCTQNAADSNYFSCPNGTNCNNAAVPVAQQVANPVARFAADNNGVILQMPQIDSGGAPSVTGTLVFGIGTQTNNAMSATTRLATTASGDVTATFNGSTVGAFLDSGSNGLFFSDASLAQCGGAGELQYYYCPSSPQALSATLIGIDRSTGNASFNVGNASTLFNSGNFAFNDIAGDFASAQTLDLGLPFFYGRNVYYGYDLRASGGQAPFIAF